MKPCKSVKTKKYRTNRVMSMFLITAILLSILSGGISHFNPIQSASARIPTMRPQLTVKNYQFLVSQLAVMMDMYPQTFWTIILTPDGQIEVLVHLFKLIWAHKRLFAA